MLGGMAMAIIGDVFPEVAARPGYRLADVGVRPGFRRRRAVWPVLGHRTWAGTFPSCARRIAGTPVLVLGARPCRRCGVTWARAMSIR